MNRFKYLLILLVLLFLTSRFAGIDQTYHQDEHRWAQVAQIHGEFASHPPINKYLLLAGGTVLGFDNLRVVPLVVSFLNLILLYLISMRLSGSMKVATFSIVLFSLNTYSAIANLQIDIDGAILPFWVLLSFYSYYFISQEQSGRNSYLWIGLFCVAITGGLLTKLSFVLALG